MFVISNHSNTHEKAAYFPKEDGTMRFRIMHWKDVWFIVDDLKRIHQRNDLP